MDDLINRRIRISINPKKLGIRGETGIDTLLPMDEKEIMFCEKCLSMISRDVGWESMNEKIKDHICTPPEYFFNKVKFVSSN